MSTRIETKTEEIDGVVKVTSEIVYPDKIKRVCEEDTKEEGTSSGWGMVHYIQKDVKSEIKCGDLIANCTLCADALQCLHCNDDNLSVNKF